MTVLPNIHLAKFCLRSFSSLWASARTHWHAPPASRRAVSTKSCWASAASLPDTAVRLAAALGTSERVWLGLQADDELEQAHRALGDLPARIKRLAA